MSSPVVGADTLEENVEKERFFAALEAGRSSPLDYSELNRQLGDTGLTSLTMGWGLTLHMLTYT